MRKFILPLLNAVAKPVYAARTTSLDPLQKYKFRVSIPGLPTTMGFQKVGGLSEEYAVTEYNEGQYEYTHKLPGRPKVGEVTLERGEYADSYLHDKVKECLTNANLRSTIIIHDLDRHGNIARTYKLAEAWASKWEGSERDSTSDDVAIEKITIQFEYYL